MTAPAGSPTGPQGLNRLGFSMLVLFMGITWGAAISLAKVGTLNGAHPVGFALWQTLGAGTVLLLISIARRNPPRLTSEVLRFNGICGLAGLALPVVGLVWATRYLPAGVVAIAFASMPLFTYALTALFRIERVEVLRVAGVLVGLSAILVIVLPESALPGAELAPWVLLTVTCSLSMSIENTYIALRHPVGAGAFALACGRQYAAALLLAPFALALDVTIPLFTEWTAMQWAATGACFASAFAYSTLLFVIRTAGPVFASQTAYVITIAGVFWGMLIFSERHSPYIWAALCLMLLGLALVRPKENTAPDTGKS
jgi:drug/metabolite transporter (DMT)-like permease